MIGINFIGPNLNSHENQRADEISRLPGLPKPYRRENLISKHLIHASYLDALELTHRNHINLASHKGFECVSYYSEDQRGTALCSKEEIGYLSTISAAFVRRLVKISSLIGAALDRRESIPSDPSPEITQPRLQQDLELNALLEGNAEVSELEALEIVSNWPLKGPQNDLGAYTLFYDMIRLIWIHEWAHALCGHVAVVENDLGISRLYEFSTDRAGIDSDDESPFSKNEVMQAIEIHADEFAIKYCVRGILWGYDPMAEIAGPKINLVDRLLIFNVACCVFTVIWTLAENKYAPEDTFYPPLPPLTSDEPYPLFVTTKSTHPPAVLRYDRFRNFQRELTMQYGFQKGSPQLGTLVDGLSLTFLNTLGEISLYFPSLEVVTPMVSRSPVQKRLEAYENHLLTVGAYLQPKLEEFGYLPTS